MQRHDGVAAERDIQSVHRAACMALWVRHLTGLSGGEGGPRGSLQLIEPRVTRDFILML